MRKTLFAMILGASMTACIGPLAALSPAAKMQEAATDLATNQRFNRMELAAEKVSPTERAKFFDRRKEWGNRIRIADCELTSMRLKDSKAEVMMSVSWFVVDEEELRGTTIKQAWKEDAKGDWTLTSEERLDGDLGLFGEANAPHKVKSEGPPKNAQFPTIRLGQAPVAPAAPRTETIDDPREPAPAAEIHAPNAPATPAEPPVTKADESASAAPVPAADTK